MTMPGSPQWTVTSVQPRTEYDPTVGPVEGARVFFQTNTGLANYVFVPNSQISNQDAVRAAIQTRVEQLHGIASMKSS